MGKPYGKFKRKVTRKPRRGAEPDGTYLKIKLRGRDGASLSMQELRDGLFEAARRLGAFEDAHRVKWASVFLQLVDARGKPVLPDGKAEWEIDVYECAADQFDH